MWAALRAQALAGLVGDLYAPVPAGAVAALLQGRRLGAARLRLLPKATGASDVHPKLCVHKTRRKTHQPMPLDSWNLVRCHSQLCAVS